MTAIQDALDRAEATIRVQRRALDEEAGQRKALERQLAAYRQEAEELASEVTLLEQVSAFLNSVGEEKQEQAQGSIESLVSRGLQTIFDDTLSFHIVTSTRGKTSGVEFVVRTALPGEDAVETPVLESRGGGLSAVVGFLLRVVVLLLSAEEGQERLLVLDETFAHVSAEYLEPLGEFLREIVERSGIQIIMVTHQSEFLEYADAAYKFSASNGRTQVVPHVS